MLSPGRVVGWLGIAAAAGFAWAAAPALGRVPTATEVYKIEAPAAFASIPLEIHIDRPRWLRAGEAGTLRLGVVRVGATGDPWPKLESASAAAMVARIRAGGLTILPGEDQTAPLVATGSPLSFVWTLRAEDAGLTQATLSVSWRQYLGAAGTSESLLWTRFIPLEIRGRSMSVSTGLLGMAGGVALWLLTRRFKGG